MLTYYSVMCSCGDVIMFDTHKEAKEHIELETSVLLGHSVDMSKHVMQIEKLQDDVRMDDL
jgi:hypothetical protein